VNTKPKSSEVWYADLGMVAKGRPVLVLSYPDKEDARSLTVVAPLTSQIRGLRGEVDIGKPNWLPKHSAVNIQGLASIGRYNLERRLGRLSAKQMESVKDALREMLQL
jgi:mRNA interferase MazF